MCTNQKTNNTVIYTQGTPSNMAQLMKLYAIKYDSLLDLQFFLFLSGNSML